MDKDVWRIDKQPKASCECRTPLINQAPIPPKPTHTHPRESLQGPVESQRRGRGRWSHPDGAAIISAISVCMHAGAGMHCVIWDTSEDYKEMRNRFRLLLKHWSGRISAEFSKWACLCQRWTNQWHGHKQISYSGNKINPTDFCKFSTARSDWFDSRTILLGIRACNSPTSTILKSCL